ncbi:N-acetylneuraminate synthase family protein [Clostridium sp. ZBS13]|uniref:N-acetylneuraminate synthase family protein n=1 Tax=Clostridium sp. ZBS13 TaxID=2949971 RepID=UPI00207ADC8D|nr:N-acetylneuraminate synthase family protein [Clostridium sp. ZBS13]
MKKIKVNDYRYIGNDEPCFIIAEAGINHNGDIDIAKKMIDIAKECGVDAIKFQTFKAEEFISNKKEMYTYKSQGKEITESMYEMFKRYEFTKSEWLEIASYCNDKDIIFFSTPQNPSDLDFLLQIVELPVIKVGADDLTNLELMSYYASKSKPMIISAGMAYISEIEDAVEVIRKENNEELIILHCVSSYPAGAEEVNLNKMNTIKHAFEVITGFSDHTIGTTASIGAVTLGAKVIEKHFTLDKNMNGPDHWFSSDAEEIKKLVNDIRYIERALGSSQVKPTKNELETRKVGRRSIVAAGNIKKGDTLTEELLIFKRPGTGINPKFKKMLVGRTAKCNINIDEVIDFEKLI